MNETKCVSAGCKSPVAEGSPYLCREHGELAEQTMGNRTSKPMTATQINAIQEEALGLMRELNEYAQKHYRSQPGCTCDLMSICTRLYSALIKRLGSSSDETKPEPDVGALNRQLCEAEGHVFSRFAMHYCLRCEAAVTPGGYLAYTSSQKAPETTAGVPVHYGSDGKLHLGEGPDGRRPPKKAADGPGEEDGPWVEGWDKRSGRCICEHHDRYHFDDGTGFVRCRATADCNCKWPTSAQNGSERQENER